ncbi:MAG: Gfo/Idh/MocA family oxidoreductase [Oscillospiraceae bacterium]|jgi:predicted dehydrogenase|nr:Gfo/Idh/MocA family oxidoreductase [Oscillospiraceae bacterium]
MKTRVAFVGTGGRSGVHIERLVNFEDVELVGFMDVIPERAQGRCAQAGQGKAYDDYKTMLDDAAPEVLYVCVPPGEHGAIEREAIARGIHLFVEKPMALDLKEAEEIGALAAAKNLVTCVGFQDRYLDLVELCRTWMQGREVGLVDGAWVGGLPGVPWYPKYSTCGGQIVEQNIHIFDMVRNLFGEPAKVYCAGGRGIIQQEGYDLHDYSSAVITMQSGVVVTLHTGCYRADGAPNFPNGLSIHCTDCTIRYSLRNQAVFESKDEKILQRWKHDWQTVMNRTFIDAVRTGDTSAIRSPYADALKSLRLCLACNESMETGNVVLIGD